MMGKWDTPEHTRRKMDKARKNIGKLDLAIRKNSDKIEQQENEKQQLMKELKELRTTLAKQELAEAFIPASEVNTALEKVLEELNIELESIEKQEIRSGFTELLRGLAITRKDICEQSIDEEDASEEVVVSERQHGGFYIQYFDPDIHAGKKVYFMKLQLKLPKKEVNASD